MPDAPAPFAARSAGVLLHVASLPGGRLGPEAERFVDWLAEAGQSWWQILPLGPPDRYGSPYVGMSAFAGWPGLLAEPAAEVDRDEIDAFVERHQVWAVEWARFAGPGAIADQVRFTREWARLRAYANARGVRILGDMPLYVSARGADRRAHPDYFQDDAVAGVPPDYYSADGQLWGNPLYNWPAMRRDGFRWWVDRFRRAFELHDAVRIDHFRGLVAYWSVARGARTARVGRWRAAPGREMLGAVRDALGALPLVAEDLGVITPAVDRLRVGAGLPGMMVLQFEVANHPAQDGRLWHEADRVVYPGTHDNAPVRAWWEHATTAERQHVTESARRVGVDCDDPVEAMVALAYSAPARTAIVAAQDVLGLGSEARMNTPGRRDGNWSWRLAAGALTERHAERLRELARETGRARRSAGGAGSGGPNAE